MIKEHIVDKNLQNIKKRQDDRILLGSVMDKGGISTGITDKVLQDHFGGKRKTRKNRKRLNKL